MAPDLEPGSEAAPTAATTPATPTTAAPPPTAAPAPSVGGGPDRDASSAAVPPRPAILRATPVIALVGVLLALAGLGWSARPLRTPTQDCGTAFAFLLTGRIDVLVDPQNPPAGVTRAEAEANNRRPCQERAAARAVPALIALLSGVLLALLALVVEVGTRLRLHRRQPPWLRTVP